MLSIAAFSFDAVDFDKNVITLLTTLYGEVQKNTGYPAQP
jgi:hypothetical protein